MSIAQALGKILKSPLYSDLDWLYIDIGKQQLSRYDFRQKCLASYPISSARMGCGSVQGSAQTPLGLHCIAKKIGDDAQEHEVFRHRQATGRLWQDCCSQDDSRELITSRILWLQGLELGNNWGGDVDSFRRYIYIHGTNHEDKIGTPASHGCIRMRNGDIVALFSKVALGSLVYIDGAGIA